MGSKGREEREKNLEFKILKRIKKKTYYVSDTAMFCEYKYKQKDIPYPKEVHIIIGNNHIKKFEE